MCMLSAKAGSPAPARATRGCAGGIAPRLAACRGTASIFGGVAVGAVAAARCGSGGFDTRSTSCKKPRHVDESSFARSEFCAIVQTCGSPFCLMLCCSSGSSARAKGFTSSGRQRGWKSVLSCHWIAKLRGGSLEASGVCLASRTRDSPTLGVRKVLANQRRGKFTRLFLLFVGTVREICMVGSGTSGTSLRLLVLVAVSSLLCAYLRNLAAVRIIGGGADSIGLYCIETGIPASQRLPKTYQVVYSKWRITVLTVCIVYARLKTL